MSLLRVSRLRLLHQATASPLHKHTLSRLSTFLTCLEANHIRNMSPSGLSSSPDAAPSSAVSPPDPTTPPQPKVTFPVSAVPPNPIGEGQYIRTAAALIIGFAYSRQESYCFAQYCFENGIDLKRIEVIADNEDEIIEASRRLVERYDFVITSGGIGPTHDDITYESLGKAFGQKLVYHDETMRRLNEATKHRNWTGSQTAEQLTARNRMALFPENAEVIFVAEDIWVPVVRLAGKLCIFPGIPSLFTKMLRNLTSFIPLPPKNERPLRIQIFTDRPESMIAPYLTSLQKRLKPHAIQVGSYPILFKGVFVSLIGRDLQNKSEDPSSEGRIWLAEVAQEVEREIGGRIVSEEEVAAQKSGTVSLETTKPVAKRDESENVLTPEVAQKSASEEGAKAKY
ncbi:MoaB/Mog domain-containing protein [Gymnopilus junonius]|uniref:MoaB/Mog domain-containing protein n=1 Tax=Gymnopilus junonius TaxID=109634 RepID=A0A9P5NMY3_GYMJU|nr:MoaB/Mog domain-containing protein [Gymnopilus junonius]